MKINFGNLGAPWKDWNLWFWLWIMMQITLCLVFARIYPHYDKCWIPTLCLTLYNMSHSGYWWCLTVNLFHWHGKITDVTFLTSDLLCIRTLSLIMCNISHSAAGVWWCHTINLCDIGKVIFHSIWIPRVSMDSFNFLPFNH